MTSDGCGWVGLATRIATTCVRASVLACSLVAFTATYAQQPAQSIVVNVSDRGIEQMPAYVDRGAQGLAWTVPDIDPQGPIAIVMPSKSELDASDDAQLRARFRRDLQQRMDAARRSGVTEFEIQLVQDINKLGYADAERQALVDRFGSAAYGAIADVTEGLRATGINTLNRAFLGSNGTKVFAASLEAWSPAGKPIWERVDLFDGRAFLTPMRKAIERIGPERVRIFNTAGDLFAPYLPAMFRSIGNPATTRELKDLYFPNLKVYWLSPREARKSLFDAHISGMGYAFSFIVLEYMGNMGGYQLVADQASGRDLRGALPASGERRLPAGNAQLIPVWRETAQDISALFSAFASDHEELYGRDSGVGAALKLGVAGRAQLAAAVLQDIEDSGGGPVVWFKSRTLEAMLHQVVDVIEETVPERGAGNLSFMARHADEVKTVVEAGMEMLRGGQPSAEVMKAWDKATVSVASEAWKKAHREGLALRFRIAEREALVAASQRDVDKALRGIALGGVDRNVRQAQQNTLRATQRQLAGRAQALATARAEVEAAEARFAARILWLDTLPEFAAIAAAHAANGQITLDLADRYSDALLNLSASLFAGVIAEIPVLAPFAPTLREAVLVAERHARDTGGQAVREIYSAIDGNRSQLLDQYATYVARAVHDGQLVKSMRELYGEALLRQLGISGKQRADNERWVIAQNGRTQVASTSGPTSAVTAPPLQNPPGVEIERAEKPPDSPHALLGPPPCSSAVAGCGGIDLAARSADSPQLPTGFAAVVIDPATRRIVVLDDSARPRALEFEAHALALGLWLARTKQQAAFSLDPADPKNPSGPWLRAVYYPDALRGTPAGQQAFEADFLLKQYSFGVAVRGSEVVERPPVPGLPSIPELMSEKAENRDRSWSRLWIVADHVELTTGEGVALRGATRMGVQARRQVPDATSRTGLRDVATSDDSLEVRFAHGFARMYDRLSATEAAPLAAVRDLVTAFSIAKWMVDQRVAVDMSQVVAALNSARVESVDRISALSVRRSQETREPFVEGDRRGVRITTRNMHVFGGVDLAVKPTVRQGKALGDLRDAVVSRLQREPMTANARFQVEHEGRTYQAFTVPFMLEAAR